MYNIYISNIKNFSYTMSALDQTVTNSDGSFLDGSTFCDDPPIRSIDTDSELFAVVFKHFSLLRYSTNLRFSLGEYIIDVNDGVGLFHGEISSYIVTTTSFSLHALGYSTTDSDILEAVDMLHNELLESFQCPSINLSLSSIKASMAAGDCFFYNSNRIVTHKGVAIEATVKVDNFPPMSSLFN